MNAPTGPEPAAEAKAGGTEDSTDHPGHPSQHLPGIVTAAILAGLLIFLLAGIFTMEIPSGATSPGPLVFPIIVAVLTGVLLVAQLVAVFLPVKASMKGDMSPAARDELATEDDEGAPGADGEEQPDEAAGTDDPINAKAVIGAVGCVAVFVLILQPLGWLISAALLFVGIGFAMGERKLPSLLAAGLAISSVVQLGFGGGLGLTLPAGILSGVF